jgi:hypothetical protein
MPNNMPIVFCQKNDSILPLKAITAPFEEEVAIFLEEFQKRSENKNSGTPLFFLP